MAYVTALLRKNRSHSTIQSRKSLEISRLRLIIKSPYKPEKYFSPEGVVYLWSHKELQTALEFEDILWFKLKLLITMNFLN